MYLPASFEDQPYGRVQYYAKVVVERPWKGAIEISKHFTVLGMLDLNTDADAKVRRHIAALLLHLHCSRLALLVIVVLTCDRALSMTFVGGVKIREKPRRRQFIGEVLGLCQTCLATGHFCADR